MHAAEKRARVPVMRILLIAPAPPPYGGMAIQAELLWRKLGEDGFPAEVLGYNHPLPRTLRIFEKIPAIRTLFRALRFCFQFWRRARKCDVVHVLAASWLYFFLIVSPAVLIGRLRGKRIVLNYRAGNADGFLKRCAWLVRPVFLLAHVITAPSGFLATVISERLGISVRIVPNVVDFSRFRFRERSFLQPKMLVTRHLEPLYDVECVLRAFQEIQSAYPAASLCIAGTGTQEASLRTLSQTLELKNITFMGYVDHARLADIYRERDILLNASRVDNFPGSLMEASAAGLAVVSTNAGGIPYIYESGKSALLVPIGDCEGLASAVKRLLEDQELARRLITSGLLVCGRCNWANVRQSLYAAYGMKAARMASIAERQPVCI